MSIGRFGFALGAFLFLPTAAAHADGSHTVDFDRDVRPVLSQNCFTCHGPDVGRRMAGLRLDNSAGAFKRLSPGHVAIAPGHPESSEMLRRIALVGAGQMPPPGVGKHLDSAKIEILQKWVEQGANYEPHWAFVAPRRPALPAVKNKSWVRNPIDRFVLARLEKEHLRPSAPADRTTLIRRLSLDLVGLPPTAAEIQAYLSDRRPDAYERVVDRLLASPHYGERMAMDWLDLARYADTHGFHIDSGRSMWPWRDWVIRAFNSNLPYSDFIVDQIAGDLLPHATLDQRVATGFNRNHPITIEGGAIPDEYAAIYIEDRIDTTATAFMGLTMKCAQCHDHKYDPITQKDYYRFYAFFHNVPENGLDGKDGNAVPFIKVPTPTQAQQLQSCTAKVGLLQRQIRYHEANSVAARVLWEENASPDALKPVSNGLLVHYPFNEMKGDLIHNDASTGAATIRGKAEWKPGKGGGAVSLDGSGYADGGNAASFDRSQPFSYGAWIYPTTGDTMAVLSHMDDSADFRGWDLFLTGGKAFVHIVHKWETNAIRVNTRASIPQNQWSHLFVTYDGSSKAKGVRVYLNGKTVDLDVTHDTLTDTIKTDKPFTVGRRTPSSPFHGMISDLRVYGRELTPGEVSRLAGTETIRTILATKPELRTRDQEAELGRFYLTNLDPAYQSMSKTLAVWQNKRDAADKAIPTSMVMEEMPKPRETHILLRGAYDKPGEIVTAGVPSVLPPLPRGAPANRLGLARWLVAPNHPLTARVAVNHFWQHYFGSGLVRTAENFGTQGEEPTHPELLDWLATEFLRTGWDVKKMQKLIVTSATYMQSSSGSAALEERDPENRLLARGPRFRLPAEIVRDQALALSGLLKPAIGGPSVKPYQPPGLWEDIAFGGGFSEQSYVQDHGDKLYRRSLYTFWKRTCPPPSLQTFDAPEREFCVVRRTVTNTPLQALVLMNDPTYVEAERKMAERVLKSGTSAPWSSAFKLALGRAPQASESALLASYYRSQLVRFKKEPKSALALLSVGESMRDKSLDPAKLAACASLCGVIFNLDETMTRS